MKLASLLKKGGLWGSATATPAIGHPFNSLTLAKIAKIAKIAPVPVPVPVTVTGVKAQDLVVDNGSLGLNRWCWPHSSAMTGAEIDKHISRQVRLASLNLNEAEALADKLVLRDRAADDRRLCLECEHLLGKRAGAWRCGNWQRAGITHRARDAQLATTLVHQLQRCGGFTATQGAEHGRA